MGWRRWLVPGMVFTVLGAIAAGAWLFVAYTDPAHIRQVVQEKLGVRFVHVTVGLASARMRLLGGILVNELRLSRTDALDRGDFLYVPSAVLLHDKERILDGKMLIRRVEMHRPQLRIVRGRDGKLNLDGILAPSAPAEGERMPTILVRNGTITYEDQQVAPGIALLEIKGVNLTIVNDPLPMLSIEGSGTCDVLGPVRIKASMPRDGTALDARMELPDVPIGSGLVSRLALAVPEAARHLDGLTARAKATAEIRYCADGKPLTCRCSMEFREGEFTHPSLPGKLEGITLSATCDGTFVPEVKVEARWGGARLNARAAGVRLPTSRAELEAMPEAMAEFDITASRVPVDAALIGRLPEKFQFLQSDYSPSGPMDVSYTFRRDNGRPTRLLVVRPRDAAASFSGFRYPLRGVTGTVKVRADNPRMLDVEVDLAGRAGVRPVTIKGHVRGEGTEPEVSLDIRGDAVALDQRMFDALGPHAREVASRFLPEDLRPGGRPLGPMGKADIHAAIRRRQGSKRFRNVIRVGFKDTRLLYDEFPYPLSDVTGSLTLHPDHWEVSDFRGLHRGGVIVVSGRSHPLPGRAAVTGVGPRERVRLAISGTNIRLDEDFERALVPVRQTSVADGPVNRKSLQQIWRGLALAGTFRFAAEVIDDPNKPLDVSFSLGFDRCTMKPAFFPYAMSGVGGEVRYTGGAVRIDKFVARHGPVSISMKSAVVQPRPNGNLSVWLTGLNASNLRADAELLAALPDGLRRGLEALKLGPSFDAATSLTLDVTPGAAGTKVWWDGGIGFRDAMLRAGTDISGATGRFHCSGHFDGRHVQRADGQLALESATVLGQPLTGITARMAVESRSPETLRFRDLKATLFGGTVGGEAHVVMGAVPKYQLALDAVGVRLEQFGKHNLGTAGKQGALEGPVRASIELSGDGNDVDGMRGTGRVDVADGKMGQLPLLLDLFKAVGLRKPDGTAFEQMHMEYAIDGQRLQVQVLDLKGTSVSLRGGGGVNLDGSNAQLEFNVMPGLIGWLPPPLDRVPGLFSKQLLKITMRGTLGKGGQVRFDKELVPAVLGPLRGMMPGQEPKR